MKKLFVMTITLLFLMVLLAATTAQAASVTVTLAWDAPASTGVTGYWMYRGTKSDCSDCVKLGTTVIPATQLTYIDATPVSGTIYYYAATAVYGTTESSKSNIVKLDLTLIPEKPANLRGQTVIFL